MVTQSERNYMLNLEANGLAEQRSGPSEIQHTFNKRLSHTILLVGEVQRHMQSRLAMLSLKAIHHTTCKHLLQIGQKQARSEESPDRKNQDDRGLTDEDYA